MSCRKSQATMTPQEKQAFVDAVLTLKNTTPSRMGLGNRYDDYVMMHMNAMLTAPGWAHNAPAFFAWHRVMLRQFELDLQAIDPTIFLPYWDWTVDDSTTSSLWDPGFMGGDGDGNDSVTTGPFAFSTGRWTLNVRDPGLDRNDLQRAFGRFLAVPELPSTLQVADAVNNEIPFDIAPWGTGADPSFRDRAEGWHGLGSVHNRVHLWVGGSMLFMTSPNDPVFFLHHCNVDRLLTIWQQQHPLEGYHPTGIGGERGPLGHNLNDTLIFNEPGSPAPFPGSFPVSGTWNHHAMGYWYDTDPAQATLATPSLSFPDIPEGVGGTGFTTYRAVEVEILSCSQVTLLITAGPTPPFSAPLGLSATVTPSEAGVPTWGRLWIAYTSTTAGDSVSGSVTVQVAETGQSWVINITANTVARPTAAVALVLDHSGSMREDAGDGRAKVDKLREAVQAFTDLMRPGDGLGIVRFDDSAQRLMPVTGLGPASPVTPGSGRDQAQRIVGGNQLDPAGATSIGSGLAEGRNALDTPPAIGLAPPHAVRAMVVLTDGMENRAPMIADVAGGINANTFAIGFGTAANISVAALNQLTRNTNGYLLVTGASTPATRFRLSEYFLQILAGINNADVVLDPQGELILGAQHRIPFSVSEADMGMDVILLCAAPYYVDFQLQTPGGEMIDPRRVAGEPALQYLSRGALSYYRISLPALTGMAASSHRGQWHAVLSLSDKAKRGAGGLLNAEGLSAHTLPYRLLVHGYSNLRFKASILQQHLEPGTEVAVQASLVEYGVPVARRAMVRAEIVAPNGAATTLTLAEREPGHFAAAFTASQVGLYTVRIRAAGTTFHGTPFEREQTLTAVAVMGGNRDPGQDSVLNWLKERDRRLCELLRGMLKDGLRESRPPAGPATPGMNPDAMAQHLNTYAREADYLAVERYESDADRESAPSLRMEHVMAALWAADGAQGFAELVEGKPVERPARHAHTSGPMFDLSPEDKAAEGHKEPHGDVEPKVEPKHDADKPGHHATGAAFGLSPQDRAAAKPRKGRKKL